MNKNEKLIIDRKLWLRGEGGTASYLCRSSDYKMCPIGMFCLSLGVKQSALIGIGYPDEMSSIISIVKDKAPWLLDNPLKDTDIKEISLANDNTMTSDKTKEKIIIKVFARHNVDVVFI